MLATDKGCQPMKNRDLKWKKEKIYHIESFERLIIGELSVIIAKDPLKVRDHG